MILQLTVYPHKTYDSLFYTFPESVIFVTTCFSSTSRSGRRKCPVIPQHVLFYHRFYRRYRPSWPGFVPFSSGSLIENDSRIVLAPTVVQFWAVSGAGSTVHCPATATKHDFSFLSYGERCPNTLTFRSTLK